MSALADPAFQDCGSSCEECSHRNDNCGVSCIVLLIIMDDSIVNVGRCSFFGDCVPNRVILCRFDEQAWSEFVWYTFPACMKNE